jgi:peptidoglycan-associated lipoprotein
MNSLMRYGLAVAVAANLAACATSKPEDQAGTPGGTAGNQAATPGAAGGSQPASAAGVAMPSGRSVYYDFDKSDLRTDSRALIEANARYLREHPSTKVRIEGNADERGSAEYNLALGQRRAENVEKTLKLLGVQDSRMEAISYGKEKPRKTGRDEASWAENRRSDLVY